MVEPLVLFNQPGKCISQKDGRLSWNCHSGMPSGFPGIVNCNLPAKSQASIILEKCNAGCGKGKQNKTKTKPLGRMHCNE